MKTIKVLCCENTKILHKPGTWIIEQSEGTDFCHVAIQIDDFVYEAVFPKARVIYQSNWDKQFKTVHEYDLVLEDEEYTVFMNEVLYQLGRPYSLIQLVLIWLSNCLGVWESFINETIWNGNKALICSEFVGRPIASTKNYYFGKSLDTIDLNDIKNCLDKIGYKVR